MSTENLITQTTQPQSPPPNPPSPPEADVVIRVHEVSKVFRLWQNPTARAKFAVYEILERWSPLASWRKRATARKAVLCHEFYALKKVSTTIRKGESVGLIGRNGSGKSTLLQLIAGTLQPTHGGVEIDPSCRIAALLELGSGFNPDFTGRENVYMNGSILGLTKDEVDAQFEEILAFSEIGEFIDQPVKTYSSGMMVRLAFSVSVSVKPDILIVDEALSVGDVFFQQKCFQKLREIKEQGCSLLFVSHDMTAVRSFCDRCVLLDKGEVSFEGTSEDAIALYYSATMNKDIDAKSSLTNHQASPRSEIEEAASSHPLRAEILRHDVLSRARSRDGKRGIEIIAATFTNELGIYDMAVEMGESSTLQLLFKANKEVTKLDASIHVCDRMGNLIFAGGSMQFGEPFPPMKVNEELIVTLQLEWAVMPGPYTFSVHCAEPSDSNPNMGAIIHDKHTGIGPVDVHFDYQHKKMPFYGIARLPLDIHFEKI